MAGNVIVRLEADGNRRTGDSCILNVESPSYPPTPEEYEQCGCYSCLQHIIACLRMRHAGYEAKVEQLTAENADLEGQIATAREACPIVRRQDYFDATLLQAVEATVSHLFQSQSEASSLQRQLADALTREREALQMFFSMRAKFTTLQAESDALVVTGDALRRDLDTFMRAHGGKK